MPAKAEPRRGRPHGGRGHSRKRSRGNDVMRTPNLCTNGMYVHSTIVFNGNHYELFCSNAKKPVFGCLLC